MADIILDRYVADAEQQRSEVVPLLMAALICDVAAADPSTHKQNLIGVFDKINVAAFPTARPFSLYLKLADAVGRYKLDLRFVRVETREVLARVEGDLQARDRLSSQDLSINFAPLPIPAPGRYEFQVWANGMFLGSTFMDAVPRSQPQGR